MARAHVQTAQISRLSNRGADRLKSVSLPFLQVGYGRAPHPTALLRRPMALDMSAIIPARRNRAVRFQRGLALCGTVCCDSAISACIYTTAVRVADGERRVCPKQRPCLAAGQCPLPGIPGGRPMSERGANPPGQR
jgi:hypothetical protein